VGTCAEEGTEMTALTAFAPIDRRAVLPAAT
jgi:hypothetical protein